MNKLAVVTGGTKGIGGAIIVSFAREGFDIATCARNEQDLADLKQNIEEEYGVNVFTQPADLSLLVGCPPIRRGGKCSCCSSGCFGK